MRNYEEEIPMYSIDKANIYKISKTYLLKYLQILIRKIEIKKELLNFLNQNFF